MGSPSPHELLGPWHDFFSLAGGAAATLVGLMFVAASVGAGVFTAERQTALRSFLSPTVVAFSIVLGSCLIGVLPAATCVIPGALLLALGAFGVLYALLIWRRMIGDGAFQQIDLEDRLWYVTLPTVAYAILTAAGAAFFLAPDISVPVLAAGMCALLLTGIRNAWDMTTWAVMRRGR
jgi:hypothetical protein